MIMPLIIVHVYMYLFVCLFRAGVFHLRLKHRAHTSNTYIQRTHTHTSNAYIHIRMRIRMRISNAKSLRVTENDDNCTQLQKMPHVPLLTPAPGELSDLDRVAATVRDPRGLGEATESRVGLYLFNLLVLLI